MKQKLSKLEKKAQRKMEKAVRKANKLGKKSAKLFLALGKNILKMGDSNDYAWTAFEESLKGKKKFNLEMKQKLQKAIAGLKVSVTKIKKAA